MKKIFFLIICLFCISINTLIWAQDDFIDLGISEISPLATDLEFTQEELVTKISHQNEVPPYLAQELAVVEEPQSPVVPVDFGPVALRMAGALALVLGLLFVILFLVRKFGPYSGLASKGLIEVLEHAALAPGKNLHLVKVASETMLLASDNNGIVFVKSFDQLKASDAKRLAPMNKKTKNADFHEALEGKIRSFHPEKAIKEEFATDDVVDLQDNIHDIHAQIEKLKKMRADLK